MLHLHYELEALIDAHGLPTVLHALADVCIDKAGHIRASYDDVPLATLWRKRAKRLVRFAASMYQLGD